MMEKGLCTYSTRSNATTTTTTDSLGVFGFMGQYVCLFIFQCAWYVDIWWQILHEI